ncbi:hypothetical protein BASA81_000516 [Batrachochytrium salamandrivorans]|nr:hypothetical protein BASA81_000516 [Batrachochytrium salamandrivorans]
MQRYWTWGVFGLLAVSAVLYLLATTAKLGDYGGMIVVQMPPVSRSNTGPSPIAPNSSAASTLSPTLSPSLSLKPKIVIAYCSHDQEANIYEPVLGAEYQAKMFGPIMFPPSHYDLTIKTCLALPSHLPFGVQPTSKEGLTLLGLYDVHVRFCAFGISTVLENTFFRMGHVMEHREIKLDQEAAKLLESRGVMSPDLKTKVFVNTKTGKVVGPLLSNTCRESQKEFYKGVTLQYETKATNLMEGTLAVHMPYAYESFGRSRWNGGDPKRVIQHHNEHFGGHEMFTVRESVTRAAAFNSQQVRASKQGFVAMVNSNCGYFSSARIRSLFGYALFRALKKPVHNLGACPLDPRGSTLAGLTTEERAQLKQKYQTGIKGKGRPVAEVLAHYKFSICFENRDVDGYASEKLVSAYVSQSVPIYWGSGKYIHKIYNSKAFVHCEVPQDLSERVYSAFRSFCKRSLGSEEALNDCAEDALLDLLIPHFAPCIEQIAYLDANHTAYEEMLAQPLGTLDDNNQLTGYWDDRTYAQATRAVFDYLKLEHGPSTLDDNNQPTEYRDDRTYAQATRVCTTTALASSNR